MKTCKKISDTRCTPYNGPMEKECELSEKNRCIFKKKKTSAKKNTAMKNTHKKTCKKVSETRCSPHKGDMDLNCMLSNKGRCILKKNIVKKNKKVKNAKNTKSKYNKNTQSKKNSNKKIQSKNANKNVNKNFKKVPDNNYQNYLEWKFNIQKKITERKSQIILTEKYSNNKTKILLDSDSYKSIKFIDVPNKCKSISSYMSYKEDDDFTNKNHFIKILTCDKKCENDGIFEKSEIQTYLEYNNDACPFCKEKYKLSSTKNYPPYGTMETKIEIFKKTRKDLGISWFKITFRLEPGTNEKGPYNGDIRYAYFPICDQGILGLWLLTEAWKKGKLFGVGQSLTDVWKKNAIIYKTIHMKSRKDGGLINHGYSKNPINDIETVVLPHLISECNANGIFTPMQMDDFGM